MRPAVILAARRTPLGRFQGKLSAVSAVELGALAAGGVFREFPTAATRLDEVILGCARQAGNGPNPARQVASRAGVADEVPAFTVNKACASGLKSIALAAQAVGAGEADLILAGGMESMSRVPFLLEEIRAGYRLGSREIVDAMYRDGFLCPLCGEVMGRTAENLAEKYGIAREEQDRFAAESQRRAVEARASGRFDGETVPVSVGEETVRRDEGPREGVTPASLSRLPPAFMENGTVHAGNSCGISDGAAAVLVASEDRAGELGVKPLARIAGFVSAGVDPRYMGLGPVPALEKLERKAGWSRRNADLIELNEAFAAQVLACDRELKLDRDRLNVNGGAIALGHPVGATGARIVTTLLHEMKKRDARRGIATLCVSGGLGMAMAFERA